MFDTFKGNVIILLYIENNLLLEFIAIKLRRESTEFIYDLIIRIYLGKTEVNVFSKDKMYATAKNLF